jgi:hypothetical protein
MRRLTLTALLTLCVIILIPAVAGADDYVEGEVLVKCTEELNIDYGGEYPETGNAELDDLIVELGVYDIPEIYDFLPTGEVEDPNGKWDNDDWQDMMDEQEYNTYYDFKYSSDTDPVAAAEMFEECNIVEFAEPNYLFDTGSTFPDDTYFSYQWNFHNTGQTGGTPDADIDAPEAWDDRPFSFRVPVAAVVDTGVDLDHPDLAGNLVTGRNMLDPDSPPNDTYGHGTHVAGIIGAVTDNDRGVAGTCWNHVDIMPIKVGTGPGLSTKAICGGILWAAEEGADVENFSFGSYHNTKAMEKACEGAYSLGVVMCAAKGNDGVSTHHYPSDYKTVIAVTATDDDDVIVAEPKWPWASNYGADTEFCAPGAAIYSTYKNAGYTHMGGTSMAAPHISAAAALIQAHYPYVVDPPMDRIASARYILQNSVDDLGSDDWDTYYGWGRLNLDKLMDHIIYDTGAGCLGPYAVTRSGEDADVKAQTEGLSAFPAVFRLYQNYPNPANGTTSFKFDLPERAAGTRVTLEVYDLSGRRVATVLNENLGPGSYERRWDCSSDTGQKLPAGVYVYRLRTRADVAVRKIVLAGK